MRGLSGFTLIEMVIVIALIALVAGALVPVITRPYVAEMQVETMNEMYQLQAAIHKFNSDMGPTSATSPISDLAASGGLNRLLSKGSLADAEVGKSTQTSADPGVVHGWNPPYLTPHFPNPLVDPWGNAYVLETSGTDPDWRLRSLGPDRAQGTSDDIVFPGDNTSNAYFHSKGQIVVDIWSSNGPFAWPARAGDTNSWTVQISAYPAVTCTPMTDPSSTGTNGNTYLCPSVTLGAHSVKITDGASNTYCQTVQVSGPMNYARVYFPYPKHGLTGAAVGFDSAHAAGVSDFANWTRSTVPTDHSPTAPPGTFASTGSSVISASATSANYGSAIAKVSGIVSIGGAPGRCGVSLYLDTGTPTVIPGAGIIAEPPNLASTIPFTVVGAFYVPKGTTWKVYAVTAGIDVGTTCTASIGGDLSASVMLMNPPRFVP